MMNAAKAISFVTSEYPKCPACLHGQGGDLACGSRIERISRRQGSGGSGNCPGVRS